MRNSEILSTRRLAGQLVVAQSARPLSGRLDGKESQKETPASRQGGSEYETSAFRAEQHSRDRRTDYWIGLLAMLCGSADVGRAPVWACP
jgi:hypothetical protein